MSKRDNKKSTANMNTKAKRTAAWNGHKGGHKVRGTSGSNGAKQKKTFSPHFWRYLKSNHPALIVGETSNDKKEFYRFRKVMHSERDGRHLNEKVDPNPNPLDPEPMYISKHVRKDEKKHFSKRKYPWKYKKKDQNIS